MHTVDTDVGIHLATVGVVGILGIIIGRLSVRWVRP
jgi:hypothetical protein